jgi:hypothetical protein
MLKLAAAAKEQTDVEFDEAVEARLEAENDAPVGANDLKTLNAAVTAAKKKNDQAIADYDAFYEKVEMVRKEIAELGEVIQLSP